MDRALQDLKFAIRFLWRDRSFALTTLLTLAVCIGANAAIFAVINSVLLRPLPVPEPAQLVRIFNSYPGPAWSARRTGCPIITTACAKSTSSKSRRCTTRGV